MDEAVTSSAVNENVNETYLNSEGDFCCKQSTSKRSSMIAKMTVSDKNYINENILDDNMPASNSTNCESDLICDQPSRESDLICDQLSNCESILICSQPSQSTVLSTPVKGEPDVYARNVELSNTNKNSDMIPANFEISNHKKTDVANSRTAIINNCNAFTDENMQHMQEHKSSGNKDSQELLTTNSENYSYLESENPKSNSYVKFHDSQVEILETKVASLENVVSDLKMKLNSQEIAFKKTESQIRTEFLSNIEKLSRECNVLHKEKEAIVIRYANSEKEVIIEKKVQQELEKKLKDANKEREALAQKLKNAAAENARLACNIENKMVEIAKLQKENEKLTTDFNSREIRIKWLHNKLKTEVNSHKETQIKLEHTLQRLNEMREEAKQVRKDCQEMIKCYQEAEEIKSVKLDSQLKLKQTELEVQKQEKCDQEQVYQLLRQELEALKRKQRMTMEDNNSLTLKINSLEKERLEYEQTLSKLKDNQNMLKQEVVDLTARLSEMESLKLQLEREKEKSAASLREVERLRSTNAELQADMDACHVKEGELLEFTEKLTAKTVHLQSDHCLLEVKAQALEDELSQVKKNLAELQQKCLTLTIELENARKERGEEVQLLARKLAEKTKSVERLNTKLDEAENETRVLKRRHIASIKELSRELFQCRRRLESYESSNCIQTESSCLGSRASSNASLDVLSTNENRTFFNPSPSVAFSGSKGTDNNQSKISMADISEKLDKEMLIERIIKLQKLLARKNDKIEFLEDHIEQLVKEMRRKAKSIDLKAV